MDRCVRRRCRAPPRIGGTGVQGGAISWVDELVRCMWKAVDERTRVHSEDWLLATVTDHGHKPGGGHGEGEEGARPSFLSLHSDTVEIPTYDHDLAPTAVVPHLLELNR